MLTLKKTITTTIKTNKQTVLGRLALPKLAKVVATLLLIISAAFLPGCITSINGKPKPEPKPVEAAKAYFDLGVAYFQRGRYDLAEPKLQRSIAANPTPEAYNALALLYEELHDNAVAEDTYQKLLATFPDYGRGYLNYNIFLCKYDRRSQIAQLAEQMATRGKEIAAIGQIAAGNCAMSRGDNAAAEQFYKNALQYEKYAAGWMNLKQ